MNIDQLFYITLHLFYFFSIRILLRKYEKCGRESQEKFSLYSSFINEILHCYHLHKRFDINMFLFSFEIYWLVEEQFTINSSEGYFNWSILKLIVKLYIDKRNHNIPPNSFCTIVYFYNVTFWPIFPRNIIHFCKCSLTCISYESCRTLLLFFTCTVYL